MAMLEIDTEFHLCIFIVQFPCWVVRWILWQPEPPSGYEQTLTETLSTQEPFSITIWRDFSPILKTVLENTVHKHLRKSGNTLYRCLLSPYCPGGQF